jgi:cytosine/adenosine deaminase-related metal-dependent hydrolase
VILRARIVFPVSRPPIEDGAVVISGNQIQAVASWPDIKTAFPETPLDLGAAILLPGLVNAHCHLDYTAMNGLPPPRQFSDWIKALLALKAAATYTDYAAAWLAGAAMLARTGCTTVADIEAVPELLPEVWSATPLRVASFLELTGVKSRRAPAEILREASQKIETLKPRRGLVGLSPHAPYSTTPPLLEAAARLARENNWRVTMHVAESAEEFDMFARRGGKMFDWLQPQRDMSDCGLGTPLAQVERCGLLGENFLAIHANYLLPSDIATLARTGSSVVYCPRSHAFFQHQRFPCEELAAAGVNICLGTDSLASVFSSRQPKPELSLLAEMDQFAATHPGFPPEAIVQMATRNGARALGWQGRAGEISPGSWADLISIPFTGPVKQCAAAIVHHPGNVPLSMIDGQWITGGPALGLSTKFSTLGRDSVEH